MHRLRLSFFTFGLIVTLSSLVSWFLSAKTLLTPASSITNPEHFDMSKPFSWIKGLIQKADTEDKGGSQSHIQVSDPYAFPSGKSLLLFHTNWATYGKNFQVKDLPIDYVTDIQYAFSKLVPSPQDSACWIPVLSDPWADTDQPFSDPQKAVGGIPDDLSKKSQPFLGNLGQLFRLKHQFGKRVRVGLSIGGWTESKHFSEAVGTPKAREIFIQGIIDLLTKTVPDLFERIDFDWEHISPPGQQYGAPGNTVGPDDGPNFGIFLRNLKRALQSHPNPAVNRVSLSACVTGCPGMMSALPIKDMVDSLDTIHIMTYDFMSSSYGSTTTGHQTNLYSTSYAPQSVDTAVKAYMDAGVPAHKIMIGAVLYSRGFANSAGLGTPSHGTVQDDKEGVHDYKNLPRPGAQEFWDDKAQSAFSYDKESNVLLSYDSVDSVKAKCRYVWEKGLQGIMVWESSGDVDISHPRSIIRSLYEGLSKQM